MEAKWFFGVTGSKNGFEHYLGTEYTYEKLISIHPLELQAIALEALFFGKKLKAELPDYLAGMSTDPVAFSQEAIDQGIIPDWSDVTKLNEEKGTEYRNMYEYISEIQKRIHPVSDELPNDPLLAIASTEDADAVTDEDSYLKYVLAGHEP
jgi:hypothetical protein